jgi:hypothetical protein
VNSTADAIAAIAAATALISTRALTVDLTDIVFYSICICRSWLKRTSASIAVDFAPSVDGWGGLRHDSFRLGEDDPFGFGTNGRQCRDDDRDRTRYDREREPIVAAEM